MNLIFLAANVVLTWAASTTPNITGYKLYIGNAPGNYSQTINLGNVITTTQNVDLTQPKYFAVAAVNSWGESGKSNEVSAGNPATPGNLVASPQ